MKICESQSKFTGSAAAVDASFSSRRTGLYSRTDAGQTFRTSIKRIMAADSKKWIHLINDRKFHSVGSRTGHDVCKKMSCSATYWPTLFDLCVLCNENCTAGRLRWDTRSCALACRAIWMRFNRSSNPISDFLVKNQAIFPSIYLSFIKRWSKVCECVSCDPHLARGEQLGRSAEPVGRGLLKNSPMNNERK